MRQYLSVVPGTNHEKAVFAWEDLVWDDGRMRCSMTSGLLARYQIVGRNVGKPSDLCMLSQ